MTDSYEEIVKELESIEKKRRKLGRRARVLHRRLREPFFDESRRTVQWLGGCLILSKKRYKILATLYFAENKELMIDELEPAIWDETTDNNIKVTLSKFDTVLSDANFPYRIESVMSKGGDAMEVYDRNGVRVVNTRPALVGFRLDRKN